MQRKDVGLLLVRLGVGTTLVVHGLPKLFGGDGKQPPGWLSRYLGQNYAPGWEKSGHENFAAALGRMGIPNPEAGAFLSGVAEAAGGAALVAGFMTPLAAAAICANLGVAIRKAHWSVGFFGQGGYELAFALGMGSLAILLAGPGAISIDRLISH